MTPHSLPSLSPRTAALLLAALALPLTACATTPAASSSAPSAAPAASEASSPAATPIPSATTASATPTPTTSPTQKASASGYTMAQVRKHADAASCWTVINGNVYDLTKWVSRHPGGRARILSLCGKDGTAGFRGEHGKEKEPNQVLAGYKLGPLA